MQALYCLDATNRFTLTQAARNRIKFATRELRDLTGLTLEDIAARVSVSKSQWHNYENTNAPDLIPVHIFLPLEVHIGQAPVTRAFAAMNGLSVEAEADRSESLKLAELMGRAAREAGEAVAGLIEAAADGKMTPAEARRVAEDWSDLGQVVEDVQQLAAGVVAGAHTE